MVEEMQEGTQQSAQGGGRRARLALGVGGGGSTGIALAIAIGAWWKHEHGVEMEWSVAMAVSALVGALCSTVAICLRETRELLLALLAALVPGFKPPSGGDDAR